MECCGGDAESVTVSEDEAKEAVEMILKDKGYKIEDIQYTSEQREDEKETQRLDEVKDLVLAMQMEGLTTGKQADAFLDMSEEDFSLFKESVRKAIKQKRKLDKTLKEDMQERDDSKIEPCTPILPKSKPKHVEDEDKLSCFSSNARELLKTLISYYRMRVKNRDAVIKALENENKELQARISELGFSSEEYEDIIEDLIINKALFTEEEKEEQIEDELDYLWPECAECGRKLKPKTKIHRCEDHVVPVLERERMIKRKKDLDALEGKTCHGTFQRGTDYLK